jgi:L-threonylcarbamoyladenylate synthase
MRTLPVGDEETLAAAVSALDHGEVVVVPTDTVYGLAARPDDAGAVQGIYRAKERPADLPLPVLAASLDQVRGLGVALPDAALTLAARWWPGPLTMALGFTEAGGCPDWLAGRHEVAVRIPGHPFLLELLGHTGPLLVTSANQHGSATPPTADEAAGSLAGHVSLIIDGGTLESTPSTLVNLRSGWPVVERQGAIPASDIAGALAGLR